MQVEAEFRATSLQAEDGRQSGRAEAWSTRDPGRLGSRLRGSEPLSFKLPSRGALLCSPQEADAPGDEVGEARAQDRGWLAPSLRRSQQGQGDQEEGTGEEEELGFPAPQKARVSPERGVGAAGA